MGAEALREEVGVDGFVDEVLWFDTRRRNAMSTISRIMVAVSAVSATLCVPSAWAADVTAAKPGDEAMTCVEIATELSPYAQQMVPNLQALGSTDQELYKQGRQTQVKRRAENEALGAMATAGALDRTGILGKVYQVAQTAQTAKEQAENKAFTNSPLAKQNSTQREQLAAQAQQMQSNARLQRLMQLGQEKHCDKG
jgi:hypothetical protein